jgi:hypothetical protein
VRLRRQLNDWPDPLKPIRRSSGAISSRIINRKMSSAVSIPRHFPRFGDMIARLGAGSGMFLGVIAEIVPRCVRLDPSALPSFLPGLQLRAEVTEFDVNPRPGRRPAGARVA